MQKTTTPPRDVINIGQVTHFASQIAGAAAVLDAAHVESGAITRAIQYPNTSGTERRNAWYVELIQHSALRMQSVLDVLSVRQAETHLHSPELAAFRLLSSLTPVEKALEVLLMQDPTAAMSKLNEQLTLVCQQWMAATDVAEKAAQTMLLSPEPVIEKTFDESAAALLRKAGGSYSLTEAAVMLNVTRQALHKRIAKGNALGMLLKGEICVPKLQFSGSKKPKVIDGIGRVVKVFQQAEAGAWATLQFLIEPDPNLGAAPIDTLRQGKIEPVASAAHAYLGLDEE